MPAITEQEIKEYRYLFPVCKKFIYLNHAGVAPISLRVADAITTYSQDALREGFTAGPRWIKHIEQVRHLSAQLLGASADEIAFVKSTSHGLSLVAQGLEWKAGDEVIISAVEFPSNVYPWLALESKGVQLKKIPSQNGELDLNALTKLITKNTKLVSLSSVQFATGYRLPLEKVGTICREHDILFCVDAIQSLGAFPIDVITDKIDFLAADGHKWLLGHEGIGLFYVRKELITKIEPCLVGWNSVQGALNFDHINYQLRSTAARFEEGSNNTLSIYGLGAAIELILDIGVERIAERILLLTDRLIQGLQKLNLPVQNSLDPQYRSGIVLFSLTKERHDAALGELEQHLFAKGIYASIRNGCLRLAPHFYNSEDEIDLVLKEIKDFLHIN